MAVVDSPKAIQFKEAGISVVTDPLFEYLKAGNQSTFSLWPTQKPQLTQKYGAVACHLMRTAYANSALGNRKFYFFDLVNNKTYSEKQINNNTNLILLSDVNSIGDLIKKI
ncbi:hypothetical protein [Roseibium salinum]|uniref:Uncharacterized protein n=1 Tax=Roseibium salinum TaxID=1604349 RepID=A0ABT3R568_9HYPH|nr:hypothetical protein [Roseibium sp. DSM 29163]MCX2724339.1 hypothetical protein [Roseibium sp. DSM 29163]